MAEPKYIHDIETHHLKDAELIVPHIISMFNPKSVLDAGCGLGTFLKVFLDAGITDIKGVEGDWLEPSTLVIDKKYIVTADLEKGFSLQRRFDVALCLEVAEHLDESAAEKLIEVLTGHSDVIIFSAAIPYQGGQNHVNEQWIGYWEELFNKHQYTLYDVLRPQLWNINEIFWWYRQNIFVAIRSSVAHAFEKGPVNNYVHPELYLSKIGMLNHYKAWIDKIFSGDIEVELARAILENALKRNS